MLFRSLWKLAGKCIARCKRYTLEIADTLSNCIDSSMNYWFANVSKWIKWHVVFLESCRYNDCLQHRWVNVNSQGDEDGFRLYAANMNGRETQLAHWICRIFQLASYFLLNNHKWLLSSIVFSIVATKDRWWRVIQALQLTHRLGSLSSK